MSLFSVASDLLGRAVPALGLVQDLVGLISGSTPSVQGALQGVPQDLRGGLPPITSGGSSVGPQVLQAGMGSLVAPIGAIAGTLVRRAIGPAIVAGGVAALSGGDEVTPLPPIVPGGAPRTVTRKQFILLTARASNPGATAKKIIRSARECGIELAAATFGLNVLDVCFLIAQPPTRRSRGISAADMRRTRSTIRKVLTISQQLTALKPARRRK